MGILHWEQTESGFWYYRAGARYLGTVAQDHNGRWCWETEHPVVRRGICDNQADAKASVEIVVRRAV